MSDRLRGLLRRVARHGEHARRRTPWAVLALLLSASALAQVAPAAAGAARSYPFLQRITGPNAFDPFSEEICALTVGSVPGGEQMLVGDEATSEEVAGEKEREFEPGVDVFDASGSFYGRIESDNAHELEEPCGTTLVASNGDVYVTSTVKLEEKSTGESVEQAVIDVYAPSGRTNGHGEEKYSFVSSLTGAATPSGRFGDDLKLARDETTGTLYVADFGHAVVDEFDAEGNYLGQFAPPRALEELGEEWGGGAIAVSQSTGDVYLGVKTQIEDWEVGPGGPLFGEEIWVVDAFDPHGKLLASSQGPPDDGFGEITGIAVAPDGDLFVSDAQERAVDELNPEGSYLGRFDGEGTECGAFVTPVGVGVSASGHVYVADRREPLASYVCVFASPAAEPTIESTWSGDVTARSATLHADVDPGGAPSSYYFQLGTTPCSGEPSACVDFTAAPGSAIGSAPRIQDVSQPVDGLVANTTYHYRVIVAYGPHAETVKPGEEGTFTTETEGYGERSADGRGWELVSPPRKEGGAVEPYNGEGGAVQAAAGGGAISYLSSAPIYSSGEGCGDVAPQGAVNPEPSQILAVHEGDIWCSQDITPPYFTGSGAEEGERDYRMFSSDLARSLVEPYGDTPFPEPPLSPYDTERTPYLRSDFSCPAPPETCYTPILSAAEGYGDVTAPGAHFGGEYGDGVEAEGGSEDLEHVIVGSHEALTAGTETGAAEYLYEWTASAPPTQRLQLVSVLPPSEGGKPAKTAVLGDRNDADTRDAVAPDGSRVVWSAGAGSAVYLTDVGRGESIRVDRPAGELAPGSSVYETASADDSRIFFRNTAQLTSTPTDAGPNATDLYVYEVSGGGSEPLSGELTDLTADEAEPADVTGLVDASSDGSTVYFFAGGVLGSGINARGEHAVRSTCKDSEYGSLCNLYVVRHGATGWSAPTFIATTAAVDDANDWDEYENRVTPGHVTARVSPNGRYFAFMSDRSLTGYDNHDRFSGAADEEVFLYDAAENRLACASCNPTGERPRGVLEPAQGPEGIGLLVDTARLWEHRWLAGSVPSWDMLETGEGKARYQPRYLSDAGRLYFDSADDLVAADTNGKEDVYEYEPVGVPSGPDACSPSLSTSTGVYAADAGGCIVLLSAGESDAESAFLDASESGGVEADGSYGQQGGSDVFFVTYSRLVRRDTDGSLDVYDSHECTDASPCTEPAPEETSSCGSLAECRGAGGGGVQGVGRPASASGAGSGNLAFHSEAPPAAKKPTRAQLLAKALKACKRFKRVKKRRSCEALARKRYGPKPKHKRKAKKRTPAKKRAKKAGFRR